MTASCAHAATHEPGPGPSRGPAVLDIGADVGAAIIYTTAALEGEELEIRRRGAGWDGTHKAVRRRPAAVPDAGPGGVSDARPGPGLRRPPGRGLSPPPGPGLERGSWPSGRVRRPVRAPPGRPLRRSRPRRRPQSGRLVFGRGARRASHRDDLHSWVGNRGRLRHCWSFSCAGRDGRLRAVDRIPAVDRFPALDRFPPSLARWR